MSDELLINVKMNGPLYVFGEPSIETGHFVTMYERPWQPWWGRLMVALRLRREPEPVLCTYIVGAIVGDQRSDYSTAIDFGA